MGNQRSKAIHAQANPKLATIFKKLILKRRNMPFLTPERQKSLLKTLNCPEILIPESIWAQLIKQNRISCGAYSGGVSIRSPMRQNSTGIPDNHYGRHLIKHLENVTNLKIRSTKTDIMNLFVSKMRVCRHLTKIRNLQICFESGILSDSDMLALGLEISKNLIHLRRLSYITHYSAWTETEKGLSLFLSAINKYSTNLKSLRLSVCNISNPDDFIYGMDEIFGALAQNIDRNLSGLRHLTLEFEFCRGLSDEVLEVFAMKVRKHLIHLQSITIFDFKSYFYGKAAKKFKKALNFVPRVKIYTEVDTIWMNFPS